MKLFKIFVANVKMIYRDKIALFWALVFPLMFIALFGLFSQGMSSDNLGKLVFIDKAGGETSAQLRQVVADSGLFELQDQDWDLDQAKQALRNNKASFALVVEGEPAAPGQPPEFTLVTDVKNQNVNGAAVSFFEGLKQRYLIAGVEARLDAILQTPGLPPETAQVLASARQQLEAVSEGTPVNTEKSGRNPVKYFDVIFIGLMCMGLMNYAITGFAISLSSLREQKILKRLLTTPLPISRFMAAEIMAFIVLAFAQVAVMLAVGVGMFGAEIYGGWWFLFVLSFLGAVLFLSFGFMVAAFAKTGQSASGMANTIAIPMMFLSGVFFPLEALPNFFYQIFRFLPLSPMIQAMRSVCLEGDPVGDQLSRLLIMLAWLVVVTAVALKNFKFGDE